MLNILFRTVLFYIIFLLIENKNKYILLFNIFIWSYAVINYDQELIYFIVPSALIIILNYIFIFLSLKKPSLMKYDKNNIIINDGKINFKVLDKIDYGIDKLLFDMKKKGIYNVDDILYGTVINNELEVVRKNDNKPIDLILDGKINYNNLIKIKKDNKWLKDILKNKRISLNKVMYAFYKNEKCFIIKID